MKTTMEKADVLEVMRHAADDCLVTSNSRRDILAGIALTEARIVMVDLTAFVKTFVLNGRQKFNATPEQAALSKEAENLLARIGGNT